MLFKNTTGKNVLIRLDTEFPPIWVRVYPGKTAELPESYGLKFGLEPMEEEIKKPKVTEGKAGIKKVETKQFEDGFENKLTSIKGIGKKTAQDILKVYSTELKLKTAVANNDKLPFDDDIEQKLRDRF